MSTFSAPTTPENSGTRTRPGAYRSYTVPSKLIDTANDAETSTATGAVGTAKDIEVLYTCLNARIVSFNNASAASRPGPSAGQASGTGRDGSGTLPWVSPTERTMAAGLLQIYRVVSSGVAFLHSGQLLHCIMPLSQCWCVDGESKFVLRVRDGVFYRVELPFKTEGDKNKAEELRGTFGKVLRYEKTACPFQRGFHVDLPDTEDSPSRIRIVRSDTGKAKKWRMKGVWMPEDAALRLSSAPAVQERRDSASEGSAEDATDDSSVAQESEDESIDSQEVQSIQNSVEQSDVPVEQLASAGFEQSISQPSEVDFENTPAAGMTNLMIQRPRELLPIRSITEPVLSSESFDVGLQSQHVEDDRLSLVSSRASFHTASDNEIADVVHDQDNDAGEADQMINDIPILRRPQHTREVSEITITAPGDRPTTAGETSNRSLSPPSTPTLVADDDADDQEWHDAVTPPDTLRLRRVPKSQPRAKSPGTVGSSSTSASRAVLAPQMPNLFSPSIPGRGKQLTAALIQKAYSIILGPSANLVALMLRIAARIANGASVFHTYDLGQDMNIMHPQTKAASSVSNTPNADDWDEDDFGIPLGNTISNASRSSSLSRDRVISRGRQRTPSEIWGINSEEESPGAAIRRQEVD